MLLQHQKTGNVCSVCLAYLLFRVYLCFPRVVLPQSREVCTLFEQMMAVEVSDTRVCWHFFLM